MRLTNTRLEVRRAEDVRAELDRARAEQEVIYVLLHFCLLSLIFWFVQLLFRLYFSFPFFFFSKFPVQTIGGKRLSYLPCAFAWRVHLLPISTCHKRAARNDTMPPHTSRRASSRKEHGAMRLADYLYERPWKLVDRPKPPLFFRCS